MIIGLTGTYCAGKNYISSILEARGLPVLDVDKLGHKALEIEKDKIIAQFGSKILNNDDSEHQTAINRKKLGALVYKNAEKLAALEAIVHPTANRLSEEWVDSQKSHCVINAALLCRSSLITKIERIILVKAPFLTRVIRAKKRDKLPLGEILKRFASQKDFNAQYLSLNAEIYIVENRGLQRRWILQKSGIAKLERKIDVFLEGIK